MSKYGKGYRTTFAKVKRNPTVTASGCSTVQFSPAVKKVFKGEVKLSKDLFKKNVWFACRILSAGHQRAHRSGGTLIRSKNEMFKNILIGKIAESVAKLVMEETGKKVSDVDYSVTGVGKWDSGDLILYLEDGRVWRVSVKATKSYGQFFMLEVKDWDERGCYLQSEATPERRAELYAKAEGLDGIFRPDRLTIAEKEEIGLYDMHVAVRVDSKFCEAAERAFRRLGPEADFETIWNEIRDLDCGCEVAGCLYRAELETVIRSGNVVRKGWVIGKSQPLDADNYYVHLAELHRVA